MHCVQWPWQPAQAYRWQDKNASPLQNVFLCHSHCHRLSWDSFFKGFSQISFQESPDCVFIQCHADTTAGARNSFTVISSYYYCQNSPWFFYFLFFPGVDLSLLFCGGETEAPERLSNLFGATQKGVRMTSTFALQSWGLKTA